MLKVIKRVLRLSGDLSKRIYASFVFSFIDSIVALKRLMKKVWKPLTLSNGISHL